MQVVVFKIGKEEYAFDIQDVQEIVRLQERAKIPNMPEFMEGVINLREKVIPVISLAKKFNLNAREDNDSTRLIVLNLDADKQIAIKADEVTEVLNIEESKIEPVPSITENNKDNCVTGITRVNEKLIILLGSKKILEADEISLIEGASH